MSPIFRLTRKRRNVYSLLRELDFMPFQLETNLLQYLFCLARSASSSLGVSERHSNEMHASLVVSLG
jgi:hypothetical protein